MKKRIFVIGMLLAATLGTAGFCAHSCLQGNPPAAVVQALKAAYPNAQRIKWDQESNGWEASFEQQGQELSVVFDAQGRTLETEREIAVSELPAAVRQAVARDYPGSDVKEAAVIEANGSRTYEAEIRKGGQEMDILYKADGTRLQAQPAQQDLGSENGPDND